MMKPASIFYQLRFLCLFSCLVPLASGQAAEATVKAVQKEPPSAVAESIRKTLQPSAVQLLKGDKPVYEFWFVREVPIKAGPESAPALSRIPEAALLGAVMVHQHQHDYKDNEVEPGVYTVRFVLQPQDGDHLGTALYPYFALLIPAKRDTGPDAFTAYRPMVKASGQDTSTGHPMVLSLRPSASADDGKPKIVEPEAEHKAVRLQLPTRAGSGADKLLAFELVYEGHGKTQ